jgi:magnesium transporter
MKNTNYCETQLHPKDSAGRLIKCNVPTVSITATVGDVEKLLLKKSADFDTINYIYILNEDRKLKGIISIKELFRSPKSKLVIELSQKKITAVRSHTDQERVALLALKHNIKAVPVINKNREFLGVITSDTILNILHTENIEDVLRMAGAGKMENPEISIIKADAWLHFRKRLPWLILGLIGGIFAAFIVGFFESELKEQIALAAFIPAIVYMADAVGSQTQTIFIRSLALDQLLNLKDYILREVKVNLLIAVLLGSAITAFSYLWLNMGTLSVILGLSITTTIITAMAIAIALPLSIQKINCDPAIASGPFATVLRDIMSLLIYFGIASVLL